MVDILERLKAQPQVNGAYLKDIADAINEIEWLREEVARLLADIAVYEQNEYSDS